MNKKTCWSICFLGFLFVACLNTTVPLKPNLVLDVHQLDYGIINNMDTIWEELILQNKGNAPLIIEDVKVSCGCTIPKWVDQPILPGQKQKMEIGLVPETIGFGKKHSSIPFKKTIIIRSNIDSIFTTIPIVGVLDNYDS